MVTSEPTKKNYVAGESFDKTGMVIVAKYSDGTTKTITDYTYAPTGALKKSDKIITISYTDGGITKTMTVPITVTEQDSNGNNNGTQYPGLNSSMFQIVDGNNTNGGNSENESGSNGSGMQNNGDATISGGNLAYAGLENNIVFMVISVIVVITIVSYVSYRRYREIK